MKITTLEEHYDEVVSKTWNFSGRITTADGHWSNAALGLAGEAGETADSIKKMLFHTAGKDYKQDLLLELGDVAYYWNKIRSLSGLTVQEVLTANFEKLAGRHPELGQVGVRQERMGR